MGAQVLQDPEKVSTKIWARPWTRWTVQKSTMIGMKPKDAIKLDTIPLD